MPAPSSVLETTTPERFGLNCRVKLAVVAVFVALVFTKFTVPLTELPTGALAGKPAKLVLMSADVPATLKVAVLFAALVSLVALPVPVPATPVLVWVKLMEALTVAAGASVTRVVVLKLTTPVAGV